MKVVQCSECGRVFTNAGNLANHLRLHGPNTKDHWCVWCGKRYAYRRNLTKHKRACKALR